MFINDLFKNKNVNEGWDEFKSRAGDVAKKTADTIVSAGSAASDAVSGALDVIPKPFDEKTYQDRVSKPYPKIDGPKKTNETSKQDQLHQRHQEIRKQSGKPHPNYYKELRATFDLPDDERWEKTAELKKKYNIKESLRPGERHHFEINPATGKREYKGIRGDRTDAPNKRDSSGDAAERADRERRAHIQHDRRMTESGVEETYGGQLHTKHKKNRFKQIRKIKQTQQKAHGFSGLDESGCTMTEEGRSCPMHGLAECPGYGMIEARKGDTNFGSTVTHGSWVVYDGSKVKRFKTRDGAKAYAEKNGGKVASSEFYADNVQKQGMAEAVNEDVEHYVEALSRAGYEVNEEKVRLDPKCWKGKKIGSPKTKMKGGVRVNNCVPK